MLRSATHQSTYHETSALKHIFYSIIFCVLVISGKNCVANGPSANRNTISINYDGYN